MSVTRLLLGALAALCAAGVLVGCSGGGPDPSTVDRAAPPGPDAQPAEPNPNKKLPGPATPGG